MPHDELEADRLRRQREAFLYANWFDEARHESIPVGRFLYDARCRLTPEGQSLTETETVDLAMKTMAALLENKWFEVGVFVAEEQRFEPWDESPEHAVRRLRRMLSPGGAGPRGLGLSRTAKGQTLAVELLNELLVEEPKPTPEEAMALADGSGVVIPDDRRIGQWLPVQVERTEHYAIVQYVCWDTESYRQLEVVLLREDDGWRWRISSGGWGRDPTWHERPIGREPLRWLGSGTLWREPKLRTFQALADSRVAQLTVVRNGKTMSRSVETTFGLALLAFEGDDMIEVVPVDDLGVPVLGADGLPQRVLIESPKQPDHRPPTPGDR